MYNTVPWCGSLKISPFQPPVFFIGTKTSQTGFDGPVVIWWAQSCYATARPGTGGAIDASSPLLLPKENWPERWVQVLKKVSVTIWAGPIRILGWFSRPPWDYLNLVGFPILKPPKKVYCYIWIWGAKSYTRTGVAGLKDPTYPCTCVLDLEIHIQLS